MRRGELTRTEFGAIVTDKTNGSQVSNLRHRK